MGAHPDLPEPAARQPLSRRDFLRLAALGSLSIAGVGVLLNRAGAPVASTPVLNEQQRFLADSGAALSHSRLRVATEPTGLAQVIAALAAEEFTPLTGIRVAWETMPLDRLIETSLRDTDSQAGAYDLYDWDQAWFGRLAPHALDLRPIQQRSELAYPGYASDDLLPELVDTLATDGDRLIGVPFDVPVLVMYYRTDLLEALALAPPATLAEYVAVAQTLQQSGATTFGTFSHRAQGHYALVCEAAAWLWAHGGALFDSSGRPALGDASAQAAMDYMLDLGRLMSPAVTGWDWWDAADSFMRGEAGIGLFWNVFFPAFNDPAQSRVAGRIGVAPCPTGIAIRSAQRCGFGERPGIAMNGGSSLVISRYSREPEAAWVFLQWATSPEVLGRAAAITGATPVRRSGYNAPDQARGAHLPATLTSITSRLGTAPRLPAWSDLAVDHLAVELGRMLAGEQSTTVTLDRMARAAERAAQV